MASEEGIIGQTPAKGKTVSELEDTALANGDMAPEVGTIGQAPAKGDAAEPEDKVLDIGNMLSDEEALVE